MTISAQDQGLALEGIPMLLIHCPSSCLSTLLPHYPASVSRVWKKELGNPESPYASPQTQAAHLPWPNPEPSPCSLFTYTSSSAWLILRLPGISDPLPLWLGLLPPVLLELPQTGLKMKG